MSKPKRICDVEVSDNNLSAIDRRAHRVKSRGYTNYSPRGGILLYEWNNGAEKDELSYRSEELYITSRQSLYLAITVGCEPSIIAMKIPLTIAEGNTWLSSHMPDASTFNAHYFFDTLMQRVKITSTLSGLVSYAIAKRAEEQGVSSSALMEEIFLKALGFYGPHGVLDVSPDMLAQISCLEVKSHVSDAATEKIEARKANSKKQ